MQTKHAGIDVGQSKIHISTTEGSDPRKYPVTTITLTANWHEELDAALPPYAVVTFEPTGWHYSHPIINYIHHHRPDCQIWQVEHAATKNARDAYISGSKTDKTDAQALALIASHIAAGRPPRRTKPYHHTAAAAAFALRLAVNAYTRATRDHTRATNRYRQAAHAVSPTLAKSAAYETAVSFDIITPAELANFEKPPDMHPVSATAIRRLAAALPAVPVHPQVRQAVALAHAQMKRAEEPQAEALAQVRAIIAEPPFAEPARRLMSVPGASEIWVAAILVAAAGAADVDQWKAALGCFPQAHQSGATDTSRSTKKGYRPAMNALHLWTMQLIGSPPNPITDYFAGGVKAGGRRMTAAKSKLARILWGVINSEKGYQL